MRASSLELLRRLSGVKEAAARTWLKRAEKIPRRWTEHWPTCTPPWKECCNGVQQFDVVIVGAGPTGLACGIELKRRGLSVVLVEKGCIVNSIYNYPTHMVFFT